MGTITFEGSTFISKDGETVLDCLLREGIHVTNSCRNGICHSCLLKTTTPLDGKSQKGLSPSKRESGYFLSCQQNVDTELEIFRPDTTTLLVDGKIISQERISDSVVIIKVKTKEDYPFKAGQFTNIIREDGVCRSYSIASQSGSDELEFHIRKVPNGLLSTWLYDKDLIDTSIKLSEPLGECCLSSEMDGKDLLLIGVGTGLAPLYGVLKDAMLSQKMGKINLMHGSLVKEGLYLVEDLKSLEKAHDFFNYHPLFLKGDEKEGFIKGDLVEYIKKFEFDKTNTIVMVCGDPLLVKSLKQTVFLAGVPSKNIFSDPFVSPSANAK
ncbi:MAG: FAD-binding oxidoreductase [Bdellovibrio sp.]